MTLPDWLRAAGALARQGKIPTRRRCAKTVSVWAFERVLQSLGPDDIAIDCGANVGKFTKRMAATGATVYAFEPDAEALKRLRRGTRHFPNVTIYNQAVGASDAQVTLFRAADYEAAPRRKSVSSSVYAAKDNICADDGISVKQIDLAAFIGGLAQPVSLLKLDIEGAEVPVLEELVERGTLQHTRHVFVETHEKRIPALRSRTARLRTRLRTTREANVNLNWG